MNEPNGEWPAAEFEHAMYVIMLFPNMNVDVIVRLAAVFVNVGMDLQSAFSERPPRCADAKYNQHDRDRSLHPWQKRVRDRNPQQDYRQPDAQQRKGMTDAPERADQRRATKTFVVADDG
jgi:hypothetical protein